MFIIPYVVVASIFLHFQTGIQAASIATLTTLPDSAFDPIKLEDIKNGVETYLKKYGYLEGTINSAIGKISKTTVDQMKLAIETFQALAGLPVTGNLDEKTLKLMAQPRCGLKDILPREGNLKYASYVLADQRWNKGLLTYMVTSYSRTIRQSQTEEYIVKALQEWVNVVPLSFQRVAAGPADVEIMFASGEHGDGDSFDGLGGTLAHAFYPTIGKVHFDDDENWTVQKTALQESHFLQVALHEFGHALGLKHSSVPESVMYAYVFEDRPPKLTLHPDDLAGARALYGVPNPVPTSPTTTIVAPTNAGNMCWSNPCVNGGLCSGNTIGYFCLCTNQYTGDRCQTALNDVCLSRPCLNNGLCSAHGAGYYCLCPSPYVGDRCEAATGYPCSSYPCLNNGLCSQQSTGYICNCPSPYTGVRCQSEDMCYSNPCLNSSPCTGNAKGYFCLCRSPFTGERCETLIP